MACCTAAAVGVCFLGTPRNNSQCSRPRGREGVFFSLLSWFRHMLKLQHRPSWSHFSLSLEIIFSSSLKFSLVNKYFSISIKKNCPWEVYNAAFAHASTITLYSQSSGVIGSCLRGSLASLTDYPAVPAGPHFACGPVSINSSSAHTPASPLAGGSTFTGTLLHWFPCLPPPLPAKLYVHVCQCLGYVHMSAGVFRGQKFGSSGAGVTDNCEPPCKT